jgi:hypothetical protein
MEYISFISENIKIYTHYICRHRPNLVNKTAGWGHKNRPRVLGTYETVKLKIWRRSALFLHVYLDLYNKNQEAIFAPLQLLPLPLFYASVYCN